MSVLWHDRRTGEFFQGQQEVPISYVVVLFAVLAMALIFVIGRLLGVDATGLGLGISGLATLSVLGAYFWRGVKRENESVRLNVYKCGRCLHEWTWAEGRPQPEHRPREETWEEYKAAAETEVVERDA